MAEDTIQEAPLDILFKEFNQASNETDKIREGMINKLALQLPDIDYGKDSARDIEVKMTVYKTVDDLLKSKEGSKAGRIKVHLQRKDTENQANYQDAVINVLERIDPSLIRQGATLINPDADDDLEDQFKKSGQGEILPGELENDVPAPLSTTPCE